MRLIDADKFVLALMDASLSSVDEDTILDLVDSINTVDAVPVVRCKDCEYGYEDLSGLCCSHGPCVDCNVPEDYFCAYGERRTENNGDQTNM